MRHLIITRDGKHRGLLAIANDGVIFSGIEVKTKETYPLAQYLSPRLILWNISTLLAMAVDNYRQIPVIIKYWELPKEVMSKFTFFDPAKILLAWNKAVHILSVTTRIKGHGITGDEQKNIDMSIQQIRDVFNDENLINECIYDAQQNNEELYRTKGEYKKALRETREIINGN